MNDQIMAILKIVSPKGVENTLIDFFWYFSKNKSQDLIAHFFGHLNDSEWTRRNKHFS